jgi:heterodisulfide reductase subunit D
MNLKSVTDFEDEIYTCNRTRCGYCRIDCPVYDELKLEAYSCRGKMIIARGLIEKIIKPSQELIDSISLCADCGYCEYKCALNNSEVIDTLKADIVKAGYKNFFHNKSILAIKKYGNPYLKPIEERIEWSKGLKFSKNSNKLFYAGCSYSYNYPNYLVTISEIFDKGKTKLNYLGKSEGCCGLLMKIAGFEDEFRENVRLNMELFDKNGVDTIITPCPGCYKVFKNEYPKISPKFKLKIYHTTDYIFKLIKDGKLNPKNEIKYKVTYHDPCDLARGAKIIEEPRKIIQAISGIQLVEMRNNKFDTRCCGGGGGLLATDSEIAINIAKKRVKQAEDINVKYLVTSCATCEFTLNKAIRIMESKIKVMDLNQLILNSL